METQNIYQKLMAARIMLQESKLNKSGKNNYAGYTYFELGDFLPTVNRIFSQVGICSTICFNGNACLTLYNMDNPTETIQFTSPMATASLKGCHDVQNLGAVQTYLRRYLYINALEIVEHDALDATLGAEQPKAKPPVKPTPEEKKALTPDPHGMITDAQRKKLYAMMTEKGITKEIFTEKWGYASTKDIPQELVTTLFDWLEVYNGTAASK